MIICFVINVLSVSAQSQEWKWAKSGAGTSDDTGGGIALDANGNSYVTGYFDSPTISFGAYTLTNSGTRNIFVVKYDAGGNVLWAKHAGGTGDDIPGCIAVDAGGNAFVTGRFYSPAITFDTIVLHNVLGADVFVVKYDPSGNAVWAKGSGGTGDNWGRGICLDGAGDVFVTGLFGSPGITFGTVTLTCAGNSGVFITKYDASGNVVWAKSAVGGLDIGYNWGYSICADAAGNELVTGFFQSPAINFGNITLTNNSNILTSDIFLAKYDSYGNVIWAKSAGGTNYDQGGSISTDTAGNAYLAGEFWSGTITFDTITITTDTSAYIFVAKYNPAGDVLWVRAIKGSYECFVHADGAGNSYLAGDFYGPTITFGTKTLTSSGGDDVFVVKYNTTGDVLWAKKAGGTSGDYCRSINADAAGNAYITGFYTSAVIQFDTISLHNTSGNGFSQDFFVARLNDIVTTIPGEAVPADGMVIYPNPAGRRIIINGNGKIHGETMITVLNSRGEQIMHQQFTSQDIMEMDVTNLDCGLYLLQLRTKSGVEVKKLVIR